VPKEQVYPPFTLGVTNTDPLTMAEAYATFAGRGLHCDARPVTEIRNNEGKRLKAYPPTCQQVLPQDVADAVNDVLRGVQEPGGFGYNAGINTSQPSAGKTGTINKNMAVWFIGYTPNLSTASMIAGANSKGEWVTLNGQVVGGSYIAEAAGSTNAGPMWGDAMKVVEQWLPDADFTPPDPTTIRGKMTTVPSVYGYSTEEAARILREAGFSPIVGPMVDNENAAGTVAYLSPASGTDVGSGSTVTIYVSDGSPYVPPQPEPQPEPEPEPRDPQPRPRDGGGGGGGDGGNGAVRLAQ